MEKKKTSEYIEQVLGKKVEQEVALRATEYGNSRTKDKAKLAQYIASDIHDDIFQVCVNDWLNDNPYSNDIEYDKFESSLHNLIHHSSKKFFGLVDITKKTFVDECVELALKAKQ